MKSLVIGILAAVSLMTTKQSVSAFPSQFKDCSGQIYEASTHALITFDDLVSKLNSTEVAVFGERHETLGHAEASACVLRALSQHERSSSLVMEMISVDSNELIDKYMRENSESAAGLGVALKWWDSGWPAFSNWLPLIETAFLSRTAIRGGDLAHSDGPEEPVSASELKDIKARLGVEFSAIESSWREAMISANCGLLDKPQAERLAVYQIRRDLSIAQAVLNEVDRKSVVLAQVGRSHAGKDRSLYRVLRDKSDGELLTIGAFSDGEMVTESDWRGFDYVWIVGQNSKKNICSLVSPGAQR